MADTIRLQPIGTYQTGIFDESAAEINAYDPQTQRLFITNANSGTIEVLDISEPTNPVKLDFEIDANDVDVPDDRMVSGINSVTVKNGIVVIAVEVVAAGDDSIQLPGAVAFYNTNGEFLNSVEVGALPDMVTFTPDGNKIVVANEGEPNSEYDFDPEGSVSIVDISNGVENATVTTADFTAFNDNIPEGVRVFGPNATAAQDFEPEYITVSSDSTTAYVTLQENNAVAVVNLTQGEVTAVVPLGFKDHNLAPSLETYFFAEENLPVIGTTEARGDIRLSGFSGLYFEGVNQENGNLIFVTHPDRGPDNGTDNDGNRIFLLPELQPQIVRFELNQNSGDLTIIDQIGLTDTEGNPLTGLPNIADVDPDTPVDEDGNALNYDPLGADLEGIVRADDGTYWMVDEYRPSIYHFEADGTLIERYVPEGSPTEVGTAALPEVYDTRRANRGFEAVAYQDGKVYAFIQTPLNNPTSGESRTIRILEFDPETETTVGEYLYLQEDIGGGSDKIGDAVALDKTGEFLVIERDSSTEDDSQKKVFRINLANATNLQDLADDILAEGETFESLSLEELAAKGIIPVTKEIHADLTQLGYTFTDKPEGLALINETTIAVINDNDFGAEGIDTGLGIITINNGLDASNQDDAINIRNWPVFGMYQPDAIDSFEINGETYLITANEGDSRDYDGFSEEARIADVNLDPNAFPNAAELQADEQLGRLLITTTLGISDTPFFTAELSGEQEVPAVETEANGESLLWIDENEDLNFSLTVFGLDFGTLAGTDAQTETTDDDVVGLHIHEEVRGVNGGVVFNILEDDDLTISLNADGSATLKGIWQENTIEPTDLGEDTEYYLNVHTNANQSGEIRGQIVGDVAYDELYSFGGRSFSIWNAQGELVFDSGNEFEKIIAEQLPDNFNSNNDENQSFDSRSDDKGPEPEGVTTGIVDGVLYGFIGLERVGGVMVYDLTEPSAPEFVEYLNNRDFSIELGDEPTPEQLAAVGDLGPEGLTFISAEDSPNGEALLVVSNEVSGSTTIYEINPVNNFTLQILHASDQEAGVPAFKDAIGFSAVMNALDGQYENSLKLSSGDLFIAGPFFGASQDIYGASGIADILVQNELGWDAAAVGNHEFDAGDSTFFNLLAPDAEITGTGIGEGGYLGANFPYLATNLDYSAASIPEGLNVVEGGQAPQSNSLTSSVVIDVNGESIGVLGAVTPYLTSIANTGSVIVTTGDGITATTPIAEQVTALIENLQPEVQALVDDGINKIILMTHLQEAEIEQALAQALVDQNIPVDVIIGGGSHRVMASEDTPLRQDETQTPPQLLQPYPQEFSNGEAKIYYVNTGSNYRYLSQFVPTFDENGVIISVGEDSQTFATDINGVDRLYEEEITTFEEVIAKADPELVAVVQGVETFVNSLDGNIFGQVDVFLNGTRGDVRTQETNLGNLAADAQAYYAELYLQEHDLLSGFEEIQISFKNGGGIRDNIGVSFVQGGTNELIQAPPQANPEVGKEEGDISELDISNSLRFNNDLVVGTVTAEGLLAIAEHMVSAVETISGRFGQISGFKFSFDPDAEAGSRIQSLALTDDNNETLEVLVENGELVVSGDRTFSVTTIGFLADGGDSYPDVISNRSNLLDFEEPESLGNADLDSGTEQDALGEFLAAFHNPDEGQSPYAEADTTPEEDERIQNLNFREDAIVSDAEELPVNIFGGLNADNLDASDPEGGFDGNNTLIFVGAGDDFVDTSESTTGNNRIYTGTGNDEIIAGNGDRIFAGNGNDEIIMAQGTGGNRAYGGNGADTFTLGANDRLFGNNGNDRFFVGTGGNNIINGGLGADQFWIANAGDLPNSANRITDFTQGEDVIGIGGDFGEDLDNFDDLDINITEGITTISVNFAGIDTELAILNGEFNLTETDFVFA